MMCQLTCRSRWNVMLGVLDGADEASASDRERAVRQLTMSESGFLGEIPYVVVAEVTSIACYVFSCHREMLMEFFEMLFNSRTSITPTGEEVAEELEPDDQPGSNREFIPDDWEKENLLYLSSAVGMGLGYLEKVQRLSDKGRPWFLRTVLGHFQPAEHSHCLGLLRIWDELVRPVEEQGGTFEAELPTRMLPQVHHDPPPYDASSYPGFDHIYYITNLIEHGWPFWDLDRTVALDLSLGLGSTYSESIWRVLHTGREEELILSCPFWLPEHEWQPIIKKMLLPDFDASDLLNQLMTDLMETTFGMTIGSRHGRRWEKDDETKLSLEERADRAKNRLEFFRELMNNLDRHNGLGPAGSIGH
ncbi:hypothetical protein QBC41DRAFT_233307 [Cercophora samala]|uniref:Uncharacterized protein n=1 Tax=Cercophora samala TaxID=330535 RepID=A0AA39Z7N8_9PEZI|nr:hypothetical protein QBC41DRAFT_233307 [Cercophora samala]